MSSIKRKDSKRIKTKVVLLPTDKVSFLRTYCGSQMHISNSTIKEPYYQDLHLYFLSGISYVNKGEYYYDTSDKTIKCATGYYQSAVVDKIITTTDKELKIEMPPSMIAPHGYDTEYPNPSRSFLAKYMDRFNMGMTIEYVLLEYESYLTPGWVPSYSNPDNSNLEEPAELDYRLKVNEKDNTITTHPIKETWDKEDLQIFNNKMNQNHLKFMYDRLVHVHKENPNVDYMLKMREICDWVDGNVTNN